MVTDHPAPHEPGGWSEAGRLPGSIKSCNIPQPHLWILWPLANGFDRNMFLETVSFKIKNMISIYPRS